MPASGDYLLLSSDTCAGNRYLVHRNEGDVGMTTFEVLLMAHLIGDWLLQNEWQAQNKSRNWFALLSHIAIYHIVVFVFLYLGTGLRLVPVLCVVGGLAIAHSVLDRQVAVKWLMRTLRLTVNRDPERWLAIVVDQVLHLLLLGASSLYLSHFGR